jgi:hypothetical protein
MLIMSMDGPQFVCDTCQSLLTEGFALFRPLTGPGDRTEVLTVCSKICSKSDMVTTLLPRYSSRPLRQVIAQLDETLAEVHTR